MTHDYSVVYCFNGFSSPVDNLPVLNLVNGGKAIPVKFSLCGNQGMSIFATGYPKSQQVTCDPAAAEDGIEETLTAGGSSLTYDAASDQLLLHLEVREELGRLVPSARRQARRRHCPSRDVQVPLSQPRAGRRDRRSALRLPTG